MNSYNKNKTNEMSLSIIGARECHSEFGNNDEAENLSTSCNLLYPVNKLPEKYRHIFSNYVYFNKMQTKVIDTIFHTDKSIVVSSPTGSGKTVIFELAIINFLETFEKLPNSLANFKIIYVAPIKALCSERYEDWKKKFSIHGLKCIEITGDTEFSDDKYLIINYQLIITTPEKWDLLTRRFKEFKYHLCMVKLFLIDEVHLINQGNRGATLEAIVSRMKIIPEINNLNEFSLRFVAVSATVSNIEDIAKWLSRDQNHSAFYLKSNEDERPVKLQKIVLGYNDSPNGFKFDLDLSYKLKPLIRQYSNGRPTLIFCSTRKSVEFTCNILKKDVLIPLSNDKQRNINELLTEINNNKIKELVKLGIGCHHAGMSFPERNAVEKLFRIGFLDILVATSTLAIGVNLPAHLVIIKSTEYYTFNEGYKEYNECQVLQMIGRAGRPQFDVTATAIIMTKKSMKSRYEKILIGNQLVESHLHKYLIGHLNAEIFLGTIRDVTVARDWIRSTFLYVRACKSPQNYGMMKTHNVNEIERQLQDLCITEVKSLASAGLINFFGGNNKITSKPEGEIMAKYSISFATMKLYMHLKGTESLNDMIKLLACSKEFENIKLRRTEKIKLNILNKSKLPDAVIRFPIEEEINTHENKINCLLQAILGTLKITDVSLVQDANKIILISTRLTKVLREITFRGTKFNVARVACILAKCVSTKLWEQSKFVSKLIPKVGPVLSRDFVLNGKTTLQSIRDTDPRDLERFLNRNPPFGNYVHDFIRQIPKYKIRMSFDNYLESIVLKIMLIGYNNISKNIRFHTISILVGDSENRLLKAQQIRNEEFLKYEEGAVNLTVPLQSQFFSDKPDYTVTACLISDQWVGIDVEINLQPANHEEQTKESTSEENRISESPLKVFPTLLQTIKKRTSRTAKNQTKNEKKQISIKKYLHSLPVKNQAINKPLAEEDNDATAIVYAGADESDVATRYVTGVTIGSQTNRHNNGQINEYIKFDKDDSNSYYSYDELINDDVFSDLFVPDDNSHFDCKAFDSAVDKYCFRENENQTKYPIKDVIRLEIVEPMLLQCSKDKFSIERSENNNNESTAVNDDKVRFGSAAMSISLNKSNQIARETLNWYCRDQLENKENVNPCESEKRLNRHLPFSNVQEEELVNKRSFRKLSTSTVNKFVVKNNVFVEGNRLKIVKPFHSMFSTRTSPPWGLFDNAVDRKSDATTRRHEAKRSSTPPTSTGRLSRLIENNLKAPIDFCAAPSNAEDRFGTRSADRGADIASSVPPSGSSGSSSAARTAFRHRHGKTTLDEYFRATKTSPWPRTRHADDLAATAKLHVAGGTFCPRPEPRRRTNVADDEKSTAFHRRFLDHGYDQTDSEESRVPSLPDNALTLLLSNNGYAMKPTNKIDFAFTKAEGEGRNIF